MQERLLVLHNKTKVTISHKVSVNKVLEAFGCHGPIRLLITELIDMKHLN